MKVKHTLQNQLRLLLRRPLQIDPQKQCGVCQKGRHQKQINVLSVQLSLGGEGKRSYHPRWALQAPPWLMIDARGRLHKRGTRFTLKTANVGLRTVAKRPPDQTHRRLKRKKAVQF